MDTLFRDFRFALRRLAKDRWFTFAAVVTLALGIAANSTVFTLVNGVLLRDLPFAEPDRIVEFGSVSYLDLQDARGMTRVFDELAAVASRTMSVADEEHAAERYPGAFITANGFRTIGVRPILGRDFRDEDEQPGAPPVVILGHHLWQQTYQSDSRVVGRTLRINGIGATVIGVMPPTFGFPQTAAVWQPLSLERRELLGDRLAAALNGFGRMRSGVTLAQVQADLRGIAERIDRQYPGKDPRTPPTVAIFRSGIGGSFVVIMLRFMMGAVGFVMLIACGNVANLLLVRAAARSRDISLRVSLGASRWQVVRQLLIETTILALIAGGLGLALSAIGVRALWRAVLDTGDAPPYWMSLAIDWRVVAFLVAVSFATAIVAGVVPAMLASRPNIAHLVNESGRGYAGSRHRRRWTSVFVMGQLALTLVLLTGAGLMIRSLLVQVSTDAGVDTARLAMLRLDLPPSYATPAQRQAMYREIEDRFASVPGVRVSYATWAPLSGAGQRQLTLETDGPSDVTGRPLVGQLTIGSDYFKTLGTADVLGRTFNRADIAPATVAIVNQRVAEMFFAGSNPIGRRLRLVLPPGVTPPPNSSAEWLTIVGVAPNVRQRSTEGGPFDPIVYVPAGVTAAASTTLIARSDSDLQNTAAIVRAQMRTIDPDLPLYDVQMVDQWLAFVRWPQRIFGSMFAIFAGIALVLGVVGLYAVTAYGARQRTMEIGIRMALGARPRDVQWLVTRSAVTQLAVALAIGGVGGFMLSRVLPAQLAGTSGSDPLTLTVVAALLVVTGLVASLIPARRAMRVDPAVALRAE